jgi:hypothetical protein
MRTNKEVKQAINGLQYLGGKITLAEYKEAIGESRAAPRHLEAEEQMRVIAWCQQQGYPYNRIYAIENERKTLTPQQAARRTKMGVRPGIPDLALDIAREPFHGLKIEMKSAKGKVSELQQYEINQLRKEGYFAIVCYSAEEAIAALRGYINGA